MWATNCTVQEVLYSTRKRSFSLTRFKSGLVVQLSDSNVRKIWLILHKEKEIQNGLSHVSNKLNYYIFLSLIGLTRWTTCQVPVDNLSRALYSFIGYIRYQVEIRHVLSAENSRKTIKWSLMPKYFHHYPWLPGYSQSIHAMWNLFYCEVTSQCWGGISVLILLTCPYSEKC